MVRASVPDKIVQAAEPTTPLLSSHQSDTSSSSYKTKKWCGVRRSTCLLTMYIIAYIVYIVVGSITFAVLETSGYEEQIDEAAEVVAQDRVTNFFDRKKAILSKCPTIETDLNLLLDTTPTMKDRSMRWPFFGRPYDARNKEFQIWTPGSTILFTVSVLTTVGYGQLAPRTFSGRLFCVAYATIGVPFTLVFLSACVQRLLAPTEKFLEVLCRSSLSSKTSQLSIRIIHLAIMFVIFICGFVLLPTVVFWALESEWTLAASFYFVFISLTTIGLGDLVPGEAATKLSVNKDIYQISVAIYLLLSLVFLSLTLSVFYDIPQFNLGLHLNRHRDIYFEEEEQNNSVSISRDKTDEESK